MGKIKGWTKQGEFHWVSNKKEPFSMVFISQSGFDRYTPIIENNIIADYDYQYSSARKLNQKILKRGRLSLVEAKNIAINYMRSH